MMNTFFIIDKFNGAHKWTPQLLEKLPPYNFQNKISRTRWSSDLEVHSECTKISFFTFLSTVTANSMAEEMKLAKRLFPFGLSLLNM